MSNINPDDEWTKYRKYFLHIKKLVELDAPPVIKADALFRLIMPTLFRLIGPEACSVSLIHIMTQGMCVYSSVCMACKTRRLDGITDTGDNARYCLKCQAEFDGLMVEYSQEEIGNPDDDFGPIDLES